MATATKKHTSKKPAIQLLAESLKRLADEADKQHMVLRTKAMIAKLAWDNGASLESMAAKLGWPVSKVEAFLQSDSDIDMRSLSDLMFALNRRVGLKVTPQEDEVA